MKNLEVAKAREQIMQAAMGFGDLDHTIDMFVLVMEKSQKSTGWKDAPSWAMFRTTNNEGDVTFWEYRPERTLLGFWVHGEKYGQIEVRELKRGHLEERPK